MQAILLLQPQFFEKIWGGNELKLEFNYPLESSMVGECWAISGYIDHDSLILNGPLANQGLRSVYQSHPELFYPSTTKEFPLLTKLIDAKADLSVQVHPNDDYAKSHHLGFGKSECWYIVKTKPNALVMYGHNALTKEALRDLVEKRQWQDLLRYEPIKKGDFINVPAGAIHAICEGTLLLETQQSSDTTYRLYDYDRLDSSNKPRDLHLEEAIAVTAVPSNHEPIKNYLHTKKTVTQLIKTPYFTVEKWVITSQLSITKDRFMLVSVLDGQGTVNELPIQKGNHFIITSKAEKVSLTGNLECIVSYINE